MDQPSFAPPTTDDNFFLVRYLKPDTINEGHSNSLITKTKSYEDNLPEKSIQNLNKMPPSLIVSETPEFKGHTLACQRFITNACAGE